MRILLAVTTLLVLTAPAAWARSLRMERMESEIQVREDGAVVVSETMRVQFRGFYNGIFRVIPYGQDMGLFRSMRQLDIIQVTDDKGTKLEYWEERKRGKIRIKIRVPGAKDTTRIVKMQYVMRHVIYASDADKEADYGGMDLLRWNATGDDWAMPLDKVVVRVRLPDSIKPEEGRAVAYTGRYGVRATDYSHRIEDGAHVYETNSRLMQGEALSIGLYFPPGVVKRPSSLAMAWYFVKANWHVFLPLLAFVMWFLFWWFRGRDPLVRTIIAEFEAPYDLRPTEVGTLIDDRMDPRDLSAAFVDLAVRGVMKIEGAEKKTDTTFVLNPAGRDAATLSGWENTLLDKVFEGDKTSVSLEALRNTFPSSSGNVREDVLEHLVERKMYPRSPDSVYRHWNGLTIVVGMGLAAMGVMSKAPPIYWIVGIPCVILMFLVARAMPRRTKLGLDALARIKGLEDYLRTAEEERMAQLPLDRLEKLLPYAIALGVHERWADHMAGLYEGNPSWYGGSGVLWVDGLNGLNGGVRQSIVPISRVGSSSAGAGGWGSSWGGGTFSGGGGFSGGGFGGGGGGGW